MRDKEAERDIIQRLTWWAEHQSPIRAMLLTSSRAVPDAPIDVFSDYDVVLALTDVQSFHKDKHWLEHFGPVLAVYWDPIETEDGYLKSANVTQYESGLRIDFTLWSVELLQRVAAAPQLPPEFDAGYRVLLDKDDLTRLLKPATYRGYLPTPPTDVEYQTLIESFFLDAIAVATLLWRDDVLAAKHILDHVMKHEQLRPLLEWHIEIENQWRIKLGPYGRRLKQWLRPDLWNELANTYTNMTIAANWKALFLTLSLFRKVALEVGDSFGYLYPHDQDRRAMAYIQTIRTTSGGAKD